MRRLTSIAVVVVVGSLLSPHAFAGRGGDGGGGRAAGAAAAARAAGGRRRRPSRGCSCCPSWRAERGPSWRRSWCPSWSRRRRPSWSRRGSGRCGRSRPVCRRTHSVLQHAAFPGQRVPTQPCCQAIAATDRSWQSAELGQSAGGGGSPGYRKPTRRCKSTERWRSAGY